MDNFVEQSLFDLLSFERNFLPDSLKMLQKEFYGRSGRQSTSKTDENVKKVKEVVLENSYTTSKKMSSDLGIAFEMAQYIVVDVLGMRRMAVWPIPKDLNLVQKHHRKTVAEKLIYEVQSDLSSRNG